MAWSYEDLCNIFVALHPEGVDRNFEHRNSDFAALNVALHPEGVDRNSTLPKTGPKISVSPSTRRAWIEIV